MADYARDHGGVPPASAGAGGPASADPLERRAAAIEARVRQLQAAQAVGRWQLVVVALLVVGLFAAFAISTTRRVKDNLREERLRDAVVQRVPDVRPEFERHLRDVARDVIPVYREQAVTRFRQVGPEVANAAIQRLKTLPETSSRRLEGQLRTSHERVLTRLQPELAARFPSLTDARKKELLASYFHERIGVENEKLAEKINTMHTNEAIRVQAVLDKFGVAAEEPADARPGEREREFLHALVDVLMDTDLTGELSVPGMPGANALTAQLAGGRVAAGAGDRATTGPTTTGPATAPASGATPAPGQAATPAPAPAATPSPAAATPAADPAGPAGASSPEAAPGASAAPAPGRVQ